MSLNKKLIWIEALSTKKRKLEILQTQTRMNQMDKQWLLNVNPQISPSYSQETLMAC